MPELPEARTIASRLDAAATGCEIRSVRLNRRDMLKTGSTRSLGALAGESFSRVDTRGKYVVAHTRSRRLVIQLGMSGVVRLATEADATPTHTHLVITFVDGRQLRYRNVRRIASGLHVLPAGDADDGPLAALGPEATDITLDAFGDAIAPKRRPIKSALLDQSLLAGLGNIYTDESLARSGVRPTRLACRLTRPMVRRLHAAIGEVLAAAIAAGGSSLADANEFVDIHGAVGYFASEHRVYGRGGRPCLACGRTLTRITLGGRTTVYCPKCQA